MRERAWDEQLVKQQEKSRMRSCFEQLTVPVAVPRRLSEAKPRCYILVCVKDLEEWKNGCKINKEKKHSWRFLEEQNKKLFSLNGVLDGQVSMGVTAFLKLLKQTGLSVLL